MLDKLRRRELAAYTLILKRGRVELGEAVDLVSRYMCTTKRTARRIIKRLRRLGLVRLVQEETRFVVEPVDPVDVMVSASRDYMRARWERCYAYSKREPPGEDPFGQ